MPAPRDPDRPQHYLVVDFEATCSDDGSIPQHEMEIIEVGAVMVCAASLQPVEEFQSFVRPVRHPVLTEFCRGLTTITQADVAQARGFPEVFPVWRAWVASFAGVQFCSWGSYDRRQLEQDCHIHGCDYQHEWGHRNLKAEFSVRVAQRRRPGLADACRQAGVEMTGTHHRGIDDARNSVRLLPFLFSGSPS